jgi:hypothetical protein
MAESSSPFQVASPSALSAFKITIVYDIQPLASFYSLLVKCKTEAGFVPETGWASPKRGAFFIKAGTEGTLHFSMRNGSGASISSCVTDDCFSVTFTSDIAGALRHHS